MKQNKKTLVLFNLSLDLDSLTSIDSQYLEDESLELVKINNVDEFNKLPTIERGVIFVFQVFSKTDFENAIKILNKYFKLSRKGALRPICFSNIQNDRFLQTLRRLNCVDIIETDISPKAFRLKLKLWGRALEVYLKDYQDVRLKIGQRESSDNETVLNIGVEFNSNESINIQEIDVSEKQFIIDTEELEIITSHIQDEFIPEQEIFSDTFDFKKEKNKVQDKIKIIPFKEINLESGTLKIDVFNESNNTYYSTNKIDNLYNDEIVLEFNSKCEIKKRNWLVLDILFDYDGFNVELKIYGKVSYVEIISEDLVLVTLEFKPIKEKVFNKFMEHYQKRQKVILDYFSRVKGV